jgi:thiamine biosynthesis protein ThiS
MRLGVFPACFLPFAAVGDTGLHTSRASVKKSGAGAGRCAYNVHVPGSEELRDIRIVVNGEPRSVEPGTTLTGLLAVLDLPLDRVAVEYNRRIAAKTVWEATELLPGDQLEIVQFVGGG